MKITLKDVDKVFRKHVPKPIGTHKYFSVLIPFVEKDGELYILYEVRSMKLKQQPGEVCFPGGSVEHGEGPMNAAVRETSEELGIDRDKITVLGRGDIFYGYANYTLFSYIGMIDYEDYEKMNISQEEVERVFLVRVCDLIKNPPELFWENINAQMDESFPYADKLFVNERNPWKGTKWSIPVYSPFPHEEAILWGMTAKITASTLDTLVSTLSAIEK